jgi:hypothetical protein
MKMRLAFLSLAIFVSTPALTQDAIEKLAQQAKARGLTSTTIAPEILDFYGKTDDLGEALRHFTVAIVKPIEQLSTHDSSEIRTWYRCEVIEVLQERGYPFREQFRQPPDLPPLTDGQFWVRTLGGTVSVNGITVSQRPTLSLRTGQFYLLFLTVDRDRVAEVAGGSSGAFLLQSGGALLPHDNVEAGRRPAPLVQSLRTTSANSLPLLRDEIKKRERH